MATNVASLVSFNVYRDGSVSASFRDSSGLMRELILVVRIEECADGKIKVTGYRPQVDVFHPNPYVSPVTGERYDQWTIESKSIAWEEAQNLLRAIAPMVEGFHTDYPKVFPLMLQVAFEEGAIGT